MRNSLGGKHDGNVAPTRSKHSDTERYVVFISYSMLYEIAVNCLRLTESSTGLNAFTKLYFITFAESLVKPEGLYRSAASVLRIRSNGPHSSKCFFFQTLV